MQYIVRVVEGSIKRYLKIFPAVAVTGPRQSGKSTTLKQIFIPRYEYVSFDDPLVCDFLADDPEGFMKKYSNRVIFDEAQKVPQIFHYLKMAIDRDRQNYGKYILTGSSQFTLLKQITESLAGRVGSVSLLPFQRGEIPHPLKAQQMLMGSYPELIGRKYKFSQEWFGAYINHYIERDVRSLYNIGNLRDFQRLVMLLAARASQELNMSALAGEIGVNVKTVQNWISVLEASYIIFLVPSYHANFGKRIVKRPKVYFYDTGLVCYLTGIDNEKVLRKGPMDGPVFENYVVSEIRKFIAHHGLETAMYYFRSNLGIEVDLILERKAKQRVDFIEIKSGQTPKQEMVKSMANIINLKKKHQRQRGYLIYRGRDIKDFRDGIHCLNYKNPEDIFS